MKIKLALYRTFYGSTLALEQYASGYSPTRGDMVRISEPLEVEFPDIPGLDIEQALKEAKRAYIAEQIKRLQVEAA